MKELLKKLITSNTGISSKRFISLFALFLFTMVVIANIFGIQIQVDFIYALTAIILGSTSLTIFNKNTQ